MLRHDPSGEVVKGYEKYLRQCDLIDGAQRSAGGREELSEGVVDQFAAFFRQLASAPTLSESFCADGASHQVLVLTDLVFMRKQS